MNIWFSIVQHYVKWQRKHFMFVKSRISQIRNRHTCVLKAELDTL
jgi:hypothetical protein